VGCPPCLVPRLDRARAGASGASHVLRRLSSCLPRSEDSGGPAPPRPSGGARVACGSVQTLGIRKAFAPLSQPSGGAVTPAAARIRCLRFAHLVRRVYHHDSAMGARLATSGWLALTRQELAPCKRRHAFLGARTPGVGGRPLIMIEASPAAYPDGMLALGKSHSRTRRRPQGDSTPISTLFTAVSTCMPGVCTSVS
jgi:hypothetical protein